MKRLIVISLIAFIVILINMNDIKAVPITYNCDFSLTDIDFTYSKCINDTNLFKSGGMVKCCNLECFNLTKYQNIICPYGCGTEINEYGDGCIQPNWILTLSIIIIIIIIVIIAFYILKQK